MRHLFTMDTHDYDPNGTREIRPSVRAIIIRDGKVLMVHGLKIEAGESRTEALCREVAEEAGMVVDPASIREYGLVYRISKGEESDVFIQDNYYYLCHVDHAVTQHLDDYEAEEQFTPEFVTPAHAIETNRFHDHNGKWVIVQERESRVLELLMEEGYFQ